MRFGKTVTAYELIKEMSFKKTIVITHRPAVEDSWSSDFNLIFSGTNYRFIDKTNNSLDGYDSVMDSENDKILEEYVENGIPFVYFASIQNLRCSRRVEGKYNKNNGVFDTDWDLVIVDEAHEGTQTDLGKKVAEVLIKPNSKKLSLTGTAYSLRQNYGDNVFTWTYVDEQKMKKDWPIQHPNEKSPYEDLPTMNILTFDLSEALDDSYRFATINSAFNFKEFFRTWTNDINKDYVPVPEGKQIGDFVHENSVKAFLNLISNNDSESNYPFSSQENVEMFPHTFWLVPGVKEARALSKLLQNHPFFSQYKVVNVAGEGDEEEEYDIALNKVRTAIENNPKTITLSCGRLTTGITVREWTGIMMLSGSAETSATSYMQAIFRVQSPGSVNGKRKENCYVFDFAPDRALKVVGKVHNLTAKSDSPNDDDYKVKLGEFLNFCPIIAVEGTVMKPYDVPEMMHQINKTSIENAISTGFEDDSVYLKNAGLTRTDEDNKIIYDLSDIVLPQKKRKKEKSVIVNVHGMTEEERKTAERARKKKHKKKELTPEEKAALAKYKEEKEKQRKFFDLMRAVMIRLPVLFYGVDADVNETFQLKDFVRKIDDESWGEFMPKGLTKELFIKLLRFCNEDVIVGAGMRIRKMAKACDDYPPTIRMRKIIEIISTFKNPDKETVLTPWRVVNMHLGTTLGGYNFYSEDFEKKLDEPRFVELDATSQILLNPEVKILEMNSKSGLYPLYMTYSIYQFLLTGHEKDTSLEALQNLWNQVLKNNIFVLCKTKMAKSITIRTLAGYTGAQVNAIYLTYLLDRMKNKPDRFKNKITNPETWSIQLKEGERMKFDAVVGNPPYQGENHSQIYPFFYTSAIKISSNYVSLIFPMGWQLPKNSNNLSLMNKEEIKADRQIVSINNVHNVFPSVSGAEWVNIVLWKKGYDNGLDGEQLVYTDGKDPQTKKLEWDETALAKPDQITQLFECVTTRKDFASVQSIMSISKPYGLRKDVFARCAYYHLEEMQEEKEKDTDIKIYGSKGQIRYIPENYNLPRKTTAFDKYKVLVGSAWGNMSETSGLGGSYADVIIARPNEICTETYQESGCFTDLETARKHAKYLLTKFARALLYVNKISQMSTRAWNAVPVQDYHEDWWNKSIAEIDEELFKKYNVSDEVAQFVRNNLQTKTEKNIVNFYE